MRSRVKLLSIAWLWVPAAIKENKDGFDVERVGNAKEHVDSIQELITLVLE